MTPDQLFNIANMVALAGWLALILLPTAPQLLEPLSRLVVPGLLAIAYAVIIVPFMMQGGFGALTSLEGIASGLGQPWPLLAGWLHYLAFDLLVGCWIAERARAEGIPHWALIPVLLLTFILGPIGFLAFLAARWTLGRRS
jgi:hypothetical protein